MRLLVSENNGGIFILGNILFYLRPGLFENRTPDVDYWKSKNGTYRLHHSQIIVRSTRRYLKVNINSESCHCPQYDLNRRHFNFSIKIIYNRLETWKSAVFDNEKKSNGDALGHFTDILAVTTPKTEQSQVCWLEQ